MAYTLVDFFDKQGLRLVEAALRRAEGKPNAFVSDDPQFRQTVTQRAWESVPAPVRLLLQRQPRRWDEYFAALREVVYDLGGKVVSLRPDASERIKAVTAQFFGLPAEAATPKARRGGQQQAAQPKTDAQTRAVGIDLGTTYSLVAHLDVGGRPVCIPNGAGDLLTPSVVLFDDDGVIVGKEAVLGGAMEPERVAQCVKRDMGAQFYRKKIRGEFMPPEVISSFILKSLKADAERVLGLVSQAVITVPAYFEETRRRATMDAGKLAGWDVLEIINEPTAAAIAYGHALGYLDKSCRLARVQPLRVLVYDLGGGTFDVTIVEIRGQEFKAIATDGDVCLGGKDWDEQLMAVAAERFRQQHREDPRDNPLGLQELAMAAESAKRTLTERSKASMYINHLGSRRKIDVTRAEFEEATAALVERTRLTTEIVVRQSGFSWEKIDRILLVGGSTRMPMIARMLQELSGKPPDQSISVDEAVAHGAALYAELLAPHPGRDTKAVDFSITDVNSHSLGILGADPKTGQKLNKILLPKNSPLPRTVSKVFKTLRPNQRSVLIKVLEGESQRPEMCTAVGTCAIHNMPPELPQGWPVEVSYSYETNGRLHVSAKLKDHDAGVTVDFQRENSLADEDLDLWSEYVTEELRPDGE